MAKTFTTMIDNTANMLQDTSSAFKTLAGGWINDGLSDASIRFFWQDLIVNDYTFESVVDQQKYSLPTDFMREYKMVNIATGKEIECWDSRKWWAERGIAYSSDSLSSGTPERYVVLKEESKFLLDPPPTTAETYQFIYQKKITELSGASDTSQIVELDRYLEYYAISRGFAYYKQYDKADWWWSKAEMELVKISGWDNTSLEQTHTKDIQQGNGRIEDRGE